MELGPDNGFCEPDRNGPPRCELSLVTDDDPGPAMKTFFSVCTAGVVAGILTAAAATSGTPVRQESVRQDRTQAPRAEINRAGKTDRLAGAKATVLVQTISITAAAQRQEAARELAACEPVVSPLADWMASRRARQCAT
jgi:hypothetical protein